MELVLCHVAMSVVHLLSLHILHLFSSESLFLVHTFLLSLMFLLLHLLNVSFEGINSVLQLLHVLLRLLNITLFLHHELRLKFSLHAHLFIVALVAAYSRETVIMIVRRRVMLKRAVSIVVQRLVQAHTTTLGQGFLVCLGLLFRLPAIVVLRDCTQVSLCSLVCIHPFALRLMGVRTRGRHACFSFFSTAPVVMSRTERTDLSLVGKLGTLSCGRYTRVSHCARSFLTEVRVDIGSATAGVSCFICLLLLLSQHLLHFERSCRVASILRSRLFQRIPETLRDL